MKKLVILVMVMGLLVGGCALFQKPCTQAGADALAQAQNIRSQIQTYYGPMQGLVQYIPTAGPVLATAIPIALSTADQALDGLGKMIASGCAQDNTLTLAQIALNQIQALFDKPETKALMKAKGIKAP